MLNLLWILLGGYAVGMLLPFCLPRQRDAQRLAASISAIVATCAGIVLGFLGPRLRNPSWAR